MGDRDRKDADSADDDFARAMAADKVVPLRPDQRLRVRAASPVSPPPASSRSGASTTAGDGDEPGDDFAAPGVDRREVRKLKRGEYTPSDRQDLHGLTVVEASATVRRFLDASRHNRYRCVCIVHGRGLRSPGGVPVLKVHVRTYLRAHPAVLAYADAPRSDGGAGAVYILLRRD